MTVKELKTKLNDLPDELEVEYHGAPIEIVKEARFLGKVYVELGKTYDS